MSKLPSLKSLVAFEAAARLLNVTRAAEELGVTQSAVSQQLKNLECSLGFPLFTRNSLRLSLTDNGERLAPAVRSGFKHIEQCLMDLDRWSDQVRVGACADLLTSKLLPVLPEFKAKYPAKSVLLSPVANGTNGVGDSVDMMLFTANQAEMKADNFYAYDALEARGISVHLPDAGVLNETGRLFLAFLGSRLPYPVSN